MVDERSILTELLSLPSKQARARINDLRRDRRVDDLLVSQLVEYYGQLPAEYLATNVIHAISCHADHRQFPFMIGVLNNLAQVERNQTRQHAFEGAISGAGRLGMPEDLEVFLEAGMPWDSGPIPTKENLEKYLPLSLTDDRKKESLQRMERTANAFRYRISHRLVRAILMMLVKRDGYGVKDLDCDYAWRVAAYDGPDGRGAKGLLEEVIKRAEKSTLKESDVIKCVLDALEYRLQDLISSTAITDGASLIGCTYDPCHRAPSREHIVAREAIKQSIRHCQQCGERGTLSASDGGVLPLCARCAYVEFRYWLIHSKGFSPSLWELPPRNSPVSSQHSSAAPACTIGKNSHPERVKEIFHMYDRLVQDISEWGPSQTRWHNFVGHLQFLCDFGAPAKGSVRSVEFKPTSFWNNHQGNLCFWMWLGDHYLRNERDSPYISEMACLRIVAELLSEQPERQWTAPWLINPETQSPLYVDGYFRKHQLAVEYHGLQHFQPVEHFGGASAFSEGTKRDEIKSQLLRDHGVRLLVVRHDQLKRETIADLLRTD